MIMYACGAQREGYVKNPILCLKLTWICVIYKIYMIKKTVPNWHRNKLCWKNVSIGILQLIKQHTNVNEWIEIDNIERRLKI